MKIAAAIPIFNDEIFIEQSVQNCIDVGYDNVVYFDDGSTDSTYEKLKYFTAQYSHIDVLHNEQNSVLSNTGNRWQMVTEECKKFNPDWVMVRAADESLSYCAFRRNQDLLRKSLERIWNNSEILMVAFPMVHLWRSSWWYRADGEWGHAATNDVSDSCWRNDSGWEFINSYRKSGIHIGGHRPNKFNRRLIKVGINGYTGDVPPLSIVVLHYGVASHELIGDKIDYQLATAMAVGNRAVGVPSPLSVPAPRRWGGLNGYKAAYELNIRFEKVSQLWYEDLVPNEPQPKIKSLYNVIAKYSKPLAEKYAKIYGR